MSPKPENPLLGRIQTILLGLISSALIGCFSFLWNLNKNVAVMQEQNVQRTMRIDAVQQSVNDMRLDMKDQKNSLQDVRETVIRLEANDAKKP